MPSDIFSLSAERDGPSHISHPVMCIKLPTEAARRALAARVASGREQLIRLRPVLMESAMVSGYAQSAR